MSRILDFYNGVGTDSVGRTFTEILRLDAYTLEHNHNYIQWLFPLVEKSKYQATSPTLTHEDIVAFRNTPVLQSRVLEAYKVMLRFWDLELDGYDVYPSEGSMAWMTPNNHNFLRVTRVLRCLVVVGLWRYAKRFLEFLWYLPQEGYEDIIGVSTLNYWQDAVLEPVKGFD